MKKIVILIMSLIIIVLSLVCGCSSSNESVSDGASASTPAQEQTPVVQPKEQTPVVQKTKYDYFYDFMQANGAMVLKNSQKWLVINLTTDDELISMLGLRLSDKQVLLGITGKNAGYSVTYAFPFGNYSSTSYDGYCKFERSSGEYSEYMFSLTYSFSSHSFVYCHPGWVGGTDIWIDNDDVATFCQSCINVVQLKARQLFIAEETLGTDFDLFA